MSKICGYCGALWGDEKQMPEPHLARARMAQRCPVCYGCGTVPPDFYAQIGYGTNTARVTCRACGGAGIVWGECS